MRLSLVCVCAAAMLSQAGPPPMFEAAASAVPVGRGSGTVVLEDVNRDGALDMLTRHLETRTIHILLGDGRGSFAPVTRLTLTYPPADAQVVDINRDNRLDLVTTANTADLVEVLFGDGRGAFTPAPGSPFAISSAVDELNKRSLDVVDLNEDGHLDITAANGRRRNTLGVLLGDGRGRFTRGPVVRLEENRDRYWYELADLDGDGHLDVATASAESQAEGAPGRLLLQRGDGRVNFAPWGAPIPLEHGAGSLAFADMNRDGKLDIGIAHTDGTIGVWLNAGGGRFVPSPPVQLATRGYSLTLRDVNRDGAPDILAAMASSIVVLLQTTSGYVAAPGSPYSAGPGTYGLTVADVNGDGKVDLALPAFGGDSVTLLFGR